MIAGRHSPPGLDRLTRTGAARVAPVLACAAVAAAVLLATGVRPRELLALAGYEALFVVLPGVVALRALLPQPGSWVTQLALGWPLGYALEVALFAFGTWVGAPWLQVALPIVAGLALVARLRRRDGAPRVATTPAFDRGTAWATAAVAVAALVLFALGPFASYPLPRGVPSVVLYADNVFDIALTAEASEHWPLTNANVAGEPLRYHVLAFVHGGAIGRTTGVELDVVVLRWMPTVLLLIVALQVAWLARRVAPRRRWAPPAAVAILLLAGELDFDPNRDAPFVGLFRIDMVLSPTFAFALPFTIALAGVLARVLSNAAQPSRRTWLLVAVLTAAAIGSKGSTLLVLLGALGLFAVARLALDRVVDRRALTALALAVVVAAATYLAFFSGGGDAGATIRPLAFLDYSVFGDVRGLASGGAWDVMRLAALLAPWAGALLLVGRLRGAARLRALWLGAITLGGLLPFLVLAQPGASQLYFLHVAAPAAAVLSAWGIALAWPRSVPARRGIAAAAAAVGGGLALAGVLHALARDDADLTKALYAAIFAALLALVGVVALAVARRPRDAASCAVALLVAVAVLDGPLDVLPPWLKSERAGTPHYTADTADGPRGIDTELLTALRWLRDHSTPDDVIAVDTHTEAKGSDVARYFYAAAFAERRTFLGGWDYTAEAVAHTAEGASGLPFAERRRLNAAAYSGDRGALEVLHDRNGVRFVVVDRKHARPASALARSMPRVYASPHVEIYRLDRD